MSLDLVDTILGVATGAVAVCLGLWAFFKAKVLPRLITGEALQDPNQPVVRATLTWQDTAAGLELLAKDAEDFCPTAIVGINRGGAIVGAFLAKRMKLPRVYLLDIESARVEEQWSKRAPDLQKILLVDDALRSGRHMQAACEYLRAVYQPRELRRAVLLGLKTVRTEPDPCGATLEYRAYFTVNSQVKLPWDR